jgi:GAF domain-containing protein
VVLVEEVSSRADVPAASEAREIEDLAEIGGYLGTLEELSGLLLDDAPLEQLLTEVLDLVVDGLDRCTAASITVSEGGRYVTAASTATHVDAFDAVQYELREGPCIDALETGREHFLEDLREDSRWPAALRDRAVELGFRSLLALPLEVDGTPVGALNLLSSEPDAFRPPDRELAWRLAGPAAVTIANGRAFREVSRLSSQLQTALDRRAVIEQAKGIVVARSGCSPDEAFELLRELSQTRNRKLRDIAVAIVAARGQVADRDDGQS